VGLYDQSPPDWVTARGKGKIARLRQLDKYEPAITYYLFAALAEATTRFADHGPLTELLTNAFPAGVAAEVARQVVCHGVAGLEFEGQIAPNGALRAEVKRRVPDCPVAYTRRIAGDDGRKGVRFESATRLDCFIGDRDALGEDPKRAAGKFGLGVEAKFTSDIDDETTYSPHRNQIARIVEVGHQRCEQFYFLLVAPRSYRRARSRLYVYKMEEYQSDEGRCRLAAGHRAAPTGRRAAGMDSAHGLARLGTRRRVPVHGRKAQDGLAIDRERRTPAVLGGSAALALRVTP